MATRLRRLDVRPLFVLSLVSAACATSQSEAPMTHEAALRAKLEQARTLRTSGHGDAALSVLDEELKMEARWSQSEVPELRSLRDAEVAGAADTVDAEIRADLNAGAPLTAGKRVAVLEPLMQQPPLNPVRDRLRPDCRAGRPCPIRKRAIRRLPGCWSTLPAASFPPAPPSSPGCAFRRTHERTKTDGPELSLFPPSPPPGPASPPPPPLPPPRAPPFPPTPSRRAPGPTAAHTRHNLKTRPNSTSLPRPLLEGPLSPAGLTSTRRKLRRRPPSPPHSAICPLYTTPPGSLTTPPRPPPPPPPPRPGSGPPARNGPLRTAARTSFRRRCRGSGGSLSRPESPRRLHKRGPRFPSAHRCR